VTTKNESNERMSKSICDGDGNECPKCHQTMKRYQHPVGFIPKPGRNHFRYWDKCKPCRHLQHYGEAKVIADVSSSEIRTPHEDVFNEWYEGLGDQEWWANTDRREAFAWAWSELYAGGLHPKQIKPILSRVVEATRMRR